VPTFKKEEKRREKGRKGEGRKRREGGWKEKDELHPTLF